MMARARNEHREPSLTSRAVLRLPSDQDATGRSLGSEELDRLRSVLDSGVLTATKGRQTPELEARVASITNRRSVIACSSGTAAVHAAIAAIDPEPGDEIVTSAITDMGALAPILYQGAIPVFADVDPNTGMLSEASVAAAMSPRTRAVIVTHLFGLPAPIDAIASAAERAGCLVVEDCAQAYLTRRAGRLVGTFGALACFSMQQGKHLTTGEGGFVATDDDGLARRARLFVNKGWPYGEPTPDHEFLALNYRTTELQSAVANAQFDKLADGVERRRATVSRFATALADVAELAVPTPAPADEASWWKVPLLVDTTFPGGPDALASVLAEVGIATAPRYIQKPAFECGVFRDQRTFGSSRWPFTLARPEVLDYRQDRFPGTYAYLQRVLVLPWNERYDDHHVDALAARIRDAVAHVVETA